MAQLICDWNDLREPNLRIPGVKPVGNVVLNSQHELSKHVLCHVIEQQGNMIDVAYDNTSARWKSGTLGSRVCIKNSGVTVEPGRGVLSTNDNQCVLSNNSITRPDTFSVLLQFKVFASNSLYRYFIYSSVYTDFSVYCETNGTGWKINGTTTNLANKTEITNGEWWTFVARGSSTGKSIIFNDGSSYSNGQNAGTGSADVLCIGGRDDSSSRYSDAYIPLCVVFDTWLSDAYSYDLARNPYQLLEAA